LEGQERRRKGENWRRKRRKRQKKSGRKLERGKEIDDE
jgi:hypothetical protein